MWRLFFLAIAMAHSITLASVAGEPSSVIVAVPDPDLAAVILAKIPGVRVGVLQFDAEESDLAINARAIALRHATYFVFDQSKECLRMAMFRERLQMQGVVAINIRPFSFPRYINTRPATAAPVEQLASFLTQVSANAQVSANRE